MNTQPITALMPRGDGHQFVFYGDCCSGIPGGRYERPFARVNTALQRLDPPPDFIVFLGDHIDGAPGDPDGLRGQWQHWLTKEMAWLDSDRIPVYHITSNHNTYDLESEAVWREVFPDLPRNGPPGQEGLSYWVRRGDLLLVIVNTCFSGLGGSGHVECSWLDAVLDAQGDARYKIVAGHYPVFGVKCWSERLSWCVAEDEAEAFWSVLVRHGVLAYLCSHVIAFDVQEHEGVLQICSGGAGHNAEKGEYHHFVQAALDADEFRLQAVDPEARVRARHTSSSK